MQFDFNLKSSLLLIFFFHGTIFSLLLLKKGIQENINSSLWLSLFVFLCVCYISPFMLGYANWYSIKFYREILFFIPFQQLFLIGPILYFYTKSLLNKSFKLTFKDVIHFVPAILYLFYSLVVFIADKYIFDDYFFYANGRDKDLAPWYQLLGLISMMLYLLLSLKNYFAYKKLAYQAVSFVDLVLFNWVQKYLIAFLIILVLRIVFFILNPDWGEFGSKFWYYLSFSLLFYYIALCGFTNTVMTKQSVQKMFSAKNLEFELSQKTQAINATEFELLKTKLNDLMLKDKLYENPNLTLSDVAKKLTTNIKVASQIVNQGFEMNFNDFINKHRIDAVVRKFNSGEHVKRNLLDIAFESGFNSKATFNRAFKKQTSVTPSSYIAKDLKK